MSVHAGIAESNSHLISWQCACSVLCQFPSPASQPKPQAYSATRTPLSWPISLNFYLFSFNRESSLWSTLTLVRHILFHCCRRRYRSTRVCAHRMRLFVCLARPLQTRRAPSLTFVSHSACPRLCSSLSPFISSSSWFIHASYYPFFSPFSLLLFSALSFNTEINVISPIHRCPRKLKQRYLFSSSFDTSSSNQNQFGQPCLKSLFFSFSPPHLLAFFFRLFHIWF